MRDAVSRVEEIVGGHPGVDRNSFLLVKFVDFGAYSRDIMVYYFTKPTAWVEHLEIREEVNLQVLKALEAMGLSVALPTQAVSLIGEHPPFDQSDGSGNSI
jgi:MscS family membrane protein